MSSQDMYRENIMDYYKNPRNCGRVQNPDVVHKENNPLCGDELEISLTIVGKKIDHLLFHGKGCAISLSACSMMCEHLEGKSVDEAKAFDKEQVLEMLGIPITPVRLKCALLCLDVVHNAITQYEKHNKKNAQQNT